MRILFLGNNWVGWQVMEWLQERDEQVVGLVIHPPEKQKYDDEIVDSVQLDPSCIFDGSRINQPETLEAIQALKPDIGLSVLFGYILKSEFLDLFPNGVVNLHPAHLPYNRGAYPNVWSIVEGTPAGVTMHYVDAGIDTGDIIAQRRVPVEPIDTGETLYRKLENACVDLFEQTWPLVRSGQAPRVSQSGEAGTYHSTTDVQDIDYIDLDKKYKARELIDIIRSRTFPPYPGAYFIHQGRKVYLRLELLCEEQLGE
jgi:methionyl-tRNA formyltransferase